MVRCRSLLRVDRQALTDGSGVGKGGAWNGWTQISLGKRAADASRAHFKSGWNDFRDVGSFLKGASPYGTLDMAGNGWEWVTSAYQPYPYDPSDGREDLTQDRVRGTRGGGQDSSAEELTVTQRGRHVSRNPRGGHHNIGF